MQLRQPQAISLFGGSCWHPSGLAPVSALVLAQNKTTYTKRSLPRGDDFWCQRLPGHHPPWQSVAKTLPQAGWTLVAANSLIFRKLSKSGLLRSTDQMALETFPRPFWQENFSRCVWSLSTSSATSRGAAVGSTRL